MSLACPNCSAPISPDQRFCGQCGARLVRVCSVCGTENPVANRFCGNCGARLQDQPAPVPAPVPAAPVESARPPAAPPEERRWATVLFADLSGFTALSEQMDPEDVRELAQRCATDFGEHVR